MEEKDMLEELEENSVADIEENAENDISEQMQDRKPGNVSEGHDGHEPGADPQQNDLPGLDDDPLVDDELDADSDSDKTRMELYDWLQCVVSAVICGIFIFVFIGRTIGVDGSSMMKTLHDRDRVIMSNLFYTPKGGDIVVFQSPTESFGGTPLVKRIIAVAGQTIDIDFDTGDVFIDGIVIAEPYIREQTRNRHHFSGPVTVPEGFVFVMGDNRNSSTDSRDSKVGLVDTRYILGKVLFIAIPGLDDSNQRDWRRIGLTG